MKVGTAALLLCAAIGVNGTSASGPDAAMHVQAGLRGFLIESQGLAKFYSDRVRRPVSEPTPISAWTRHHGRCRSRSFTTTFDVGPDINSRICRGFSFLVNNTILCNRDPMHQRVSKYSEDFDHQTRCLSCARQSDPTMRSIITLLDDHGLCPG
ncbi:hypothetical protein E4U52_003583 [Claviceps spartinae]|nr:hypothetical protein E4U52_003583 [Claviceps spartinae]